MPSGGPGDDAPEPETGFRNVRPVAEITPLDSRVMPFFAASRRPAANAPIRAITIRDRPALSRARRMRVRAPRAPAPHPRSRRYCRRRGARKIVTQQAETVLERLRATDGPACAAEFRGQRLENVTQALARNTRRGFCPGLTYKINI